MAERSKNRTMSRRSLNGFAVCVAVVSPIGWAAVGGLRQRIRLRYILVGHCVCIFEVERNDLLRLVVFQDREVFGLEIAHEDFRSCRAPSRSPAPVRLYAKGVVGLLLCGRVRKQQGAAPATSPGLFASRFSVAKSCSCFLKAKARGQREPHARPLQSPGQTSASHRRVDRRIIRMLKMLETCARNSSNRDSLSGKTLVNAMSNRAFLVLRCCCGAHRHRAPAGVAKAAVLNHSAIGRIREADRLSRNYVRPYGSVGAAVDFAALPREPGVKGKPDAMVQSPLHCQSPNIARSGVFPVSQRRSCPKGSSHR